MSNLSSSGFCLLNLLSVFGTTAARATRPRRILLTAWRARMATGRVGARRSGQAGFSALELLIVMTVSSVVMAITFGSFRTLQAIVQGDADMRLVEWQLKLARETAINQRRAIEVQFTNPNLITVVRHNIPTGTTVISTIYLEHDARFMLFAGQADTPDRFGNAAPVDFGAAATVMFTADGMLTDANGNPVNGSIFIGQPGRPGTSRALTVFGPTARIRSFRWNGTGWRP